jgi:hypothetical protein
MFPYLESITFIHHHKVFKLQIKRHDGHFKIIIFLVGAEVVEINEATYDHTIVLNVATQANGMAKRANGSFIVTYHHKYCIWTEHVVPRAHYLRLSFTSRDPIDACKKLHYILYFPIALQVLI